MAEIVNLRTIRKRRRRAESAASAAESRIRHGLSHAETSAAKLARAVEERRLASHRRQRPEPSDGDPSQA